MPQYVIDKKVILMTNLENLVEAVVGRLFIPLEASGRHVHVTVDQAGILFGHGLTPERPLSQPGQFLAKERVTVRGPKGTFEHVAVLGPERKEAQVEVSLTDARHLGLKPPVRPSGDVSGSPGAELIGPRGSLRILGCLWCGDKHGNVCFHYYKGKPADTGIVGAVQFDDFTGTRRNRKDRWPEMLQERFLFVDSFCD